MTDFVSALLREFQENENGLSESLYVETDKLLTFLYGDVVSHVFRRAIDAQDGRFYMNKDLGGFLDVLQTLNNSRDPLKVLTDV